ncbi:MAG: bifunctional phosphoribosylaminoimidazolecarboxamide formyltransferase/IMP cyclohydrolase [Pseudomonadota bacterium]
MSPTPKAHKIPDLVKIETALLSVSDKTGIIELAKNLAERGIRLVSTGGTAKAIMEAGIEVSDVSSITGFPEIMDGRVKTLHPSVHGGLLAVRTDETHRSAMEEQGISPIDLAVINLYPFEETIAKGGDYDACVENIDIGGPAMIRAAAKNHGFVTVITDPEDYGEVLRQLDESQNQTDLALRKRLAHKAFARTANYDTAISNWFATVTEQSMPLHRSISGRLASKMRYGENPHQSAGFYTSGEPRPGVATAHQLQGKQLSYNNINDTDAAFELVSEFNAQDGPAVAIIKHANPCGAARGSTLAEAYEKAFACDPVSAFGGIIALNGPLDEEAAKEIVEIFTEVIIAPDATEEAKAVIAAKKNLRLLITGGLPDPSGKGLSVKTVAGGLLVQDRDNRVIDDLDLQVVTKVQPTAEQLADMKFAFQVAKHVKSNAIVYAKGLATVGIGAGQMSRVDSARIAARKAVDAMQNSGATEPGTMGSAVASDAFFPFADGLLSAVEAGATSVIQPGGSMRDDEVIAAADEAGIAMVFTGTRHFRH